MEHLSNLPGGFPELSMIPALSDEQILFSNSLATLLSNWIVIPNRDGHSRTIIALPRVSDVKIVKFTHPGLLVIAGALFLVAAAATYSKDGDGAEFPAALLGLLFLIGYMGSRRASVAFAIDATSTETVRGSVTEAAELGHAVQSARARLARYRSEEPESGFMAAAG